MYFYLLNFNAFYVPCVVIELVDLVSNSEVIDLLFCLGDDFGVFFFTFKKKKICTRFFVVSCTEVLKFWVFDLFEGKREAEQQLEKQVAKKQKGDEGVAQAVVKQKVEVKTQKKKKVETSSSEDDSSSESEEEVNFVNFMFQLLLIVYFHEQSEVITV